MLRHREKKRKSFLFICKHGNFCHFYFTLFCAIVFFFLDGCRIRIESITEQILVDVLEMSAGKQIEAAYRKNGDGVGC